MAKPSDIDAFLRHYSDAIRDRTAAVFAGAGLSIAAGFVDWRDLLKDIAREVGLNVSDEHDLVAVAQYHENEHGGRARINQTILNEFSDRATLTANHSLLAALPIHTYWTTNYDTLLEDALRTAKKRPDVKLEDSSLAATLARRDAVVYKMHGDVSLPAKAVITKNDYETYEFTRPLFSTTLQGDLVSKTFLFLGFSFSDPNLSYVLGRIRALLGPNRRDHYCLMRRVAEEDFDARDKYNYAKARQDLQMRDLARYGIRGLLLESYEEQTVILQELARIVRGRRVFVSGSAETYGPWEPTNGQRLVSLIASGLIRMDLGIVSGFGLGVGPYVINGALEALGADGSYRIDDRLVLRPFPQGIFDATTRKRLWTEYRRAMLGLAGISVFMFGNKQDAEGQVVLADGLNDEFEIAKGLGHALVPIGSTGSMSQILHARVLDNWNEFYPHHPRLRDVFAHLAKEESVEGVAKATLDFIHELSGD